MGDLSKDEWRASCISGDCSFSWLCLVIYKPHCFDWRKSLLNLSIFRYTVYQREGCPRAYQPFYTAPCTESQEFMVGEVTAPLNGQFLVKDLSPYTAYQWYIEAVNSVGESNSRTWSETKNTNPSGTLSMIAGDGSVFWWLKYLCTYSSMKWTKPCSSLYFFLRYNCVIVLT